MTDSGGGRPGPLGKPMGSRFDSISQVVPMTVAPASTMSVCSLDGGQAELRSA
jgi:hypothetical protein